MSVGHNKPYKMYSGVGAFCTYLFIIEDGVYMYHKFGTKASWKKYTSRISCKHDIMSGVIKFVKHMSEKELFLELL